MSVVAPPALLKSGSLNGKLSIPYTGTPGKGLFHMIGTHGGTQSFKNPASSGFAKDSVISVHGTASSGSPDDILAWGQRSLWTHDDKSKAWFRIDLGRQRCIRLSHYSMMRGGGAARVSNWSLLGRNSETEYWDTLINHTNDNSLIEGGQENKSHTFSVNCSHYYSDFKLKMTKKSSNNSDWYFSVACVEFYGEYRTNIKSESWCAFHTLSDQGDDLLNNAIWV